MNRRWVVKESGACGRERYLDRTACANLLAAGLETEAEVCAPDTVSEKSFAELRALLRERLGADAV